MKTNISQITKVPLPHLALAVLVLAGLASSAVQQYAGPRLDSASYAPVSKHVAAKKSWHLRGGSAGVKKTASATIAAPAPATAQSPASKAPAGSPAPSSAPKAMAQTAAPAPAKATPAAQPAPAAAATSDIASEAICPGQSAMTNVAPVLACMTAYARTQHGIASINNSAALVSAAQAKVQDMLDCGYSHTACGRAFNYWFAPKGFTGNCSAENIAQGQRTPAEVFTAWMNSPGHRTNILNGSYTSVGVAVTSSPNGNLWAMELGGC